MSLAGFGDAICKFFETYSTTQLSVQGVPRLKIECTVTVSGTAAFQHRFYSDVSFTQFSSETAYTSIVNGYNLFQLDNPPQLYAVGRFSLLPGTTLTITSLKINNVEHITSGNMILTSPALSFTSSVVNQMYLFSCPLNQITDPSLNVVFDIQNLLGAAYFEYLYYTNNTYTTLSYTTTVPVTNGTNTVSIAYANLYVVMRFRMGLNASIRVTSFKLKGSEQLASATTFNSPLIQSEICFPSGSLVKTDQGLIEIQKMDPNLHTIRQNRIVAITETYSFDEVLVCLEKDSIRPRYPDVRTFVSSKHKVYAKGKMRAAHRYVGKYPGIYHVPYTGEKLYNVLMEEYGIMNVNGLLCETLHPDNPVAKLFRNMRGLK